jgi:hypothetical protein
MYYRGCRAERQRWAEEKEEEQYTQAFGNLIDILSQELFDDGMNFFFNGDMCEIESTFNVLKREFNVLGREGWDEGDIEYEILSEGLYLSPRIQHLYDDEPVKDIPVAWRPVHFIVV